MDNLLVRTENKTYPIYFKQDFHSLDEAFKTAGLGGGKACIITDDNVSTLYAEEIKKICQTVFKEVYVLSFNAGEISKNIETIISFYNFFIEKHLDRKSVIVGLGGGVCGDMAGFAAATYMRGVKFVQIPTTLLSQVDSSVGGKVGIDHNGNKNIIGAFYQPEFVYINIRTLKTLSSREFSAGMAEVIKYGPICDKGFYEYICSNKEKIASLDEYIVAQLISRCCEIKADVVNKDEKEGGLREILNFGHTIGHAIETVKNFELLHGECVGIGMAAALHLSMLKGYLKEEEVFEFLGILEYFHIPTYVTGINAEEIYKQMFYDKKVKDNKINFVLIKEFGVYERTNNITEKEIFSAINYVIR